MNLFNKEDLIGVTGANSEYIGKRLAYARQESEKGVRYDWLIPVLEELELGSFKPFAPSPADAFRRACSDITKGYIKKEDGKKFKVSMVLINESTDPIIRNIQVTEVNKKEITSTDGKLVAQLSFTRSNEEFDVKYGWRAGHEFEDCPECVRQRIEDAQNKYQKERDLVSDQQLAGLIRRVLESCGNPIQDIPSTWNVPATREDILNKLVALSERMNEDIEPKLFNIDVLPLVNTKETRKKISADAVAYAVDRFRKMLSNEQDSIVFASDTEAQKDKSRRAIEAEAQKVLSLVEEYEMLMGEAMDEVRQAREITMMKLNKFCSDPVKQAQHRIKAEEKKGNKRKLRKASSAQDNTIVQPTDNQPKRRIQAFDMAQTELSI